MEPRNVLLIAEAAIVAIGVITVIILGAFVRRLYYDLEVVPDKERSSLRRRLKRSFWFAVATSLLVDTGIIVMAVIGPEVIDGELYGVLFAVLLAVLVMGAYICIDTMADATQVFRLHDPESQEFIQGTPRADAS